MDIEEFQCAQKCTCKKFDGSGLEVNCEKLGLAHLPEELPKRTTVLNLRLFTVFVLDLQHSYLLKSKHSNDKHSNDRKNDTLLGIFSAANDV